MSGIDDTLGSVAEKLVRLGDVGVERDDALERLGSLGGVAGIEQRSAEGEVRDLVIRVGVGSATELVDLGLLL